MVTAHPCGMQLASAERVHMWGWHVQVGWVLKGLVYAIIGGVACQASAQGVAKVKGADISPQVRTFRLHLLFPCHAF